MSILNAIVAGCVGAGAMYFFDPLVGRRRRALVRDQLVRAGRVVREELDVELRDTANRARGWMAEAGGLLRSGEADDDVLESRVRAALGRVTSHPRAIDVTVQNGTARVQGPVLADEAPRIRRAIGRVRGIERIADSLDVHAEADVPALQGEGRAPADAVRLVPAARLLLAAVGAGTFVSAAVLRPTTTLGGAGLAALGLAILLSERARSRAVRAS